MPDLVPLIDAIGEEKTLALGAFVLAFAFGALAQRSDFCTRSAVLELAGPKAWCSTGDMAGGLRSCDASCSIWHCERFGLCRRIKVFCHGAKPLGSR